MENTDPSELSPVPILMEGSLFSLLRLYLSRAEFRQTYDYTAGREEIIAIRDAIRTVTQIRRGAEFGRGSCLQCAVTAILLDGGPPVPKEMKSSSVTSVSSERKEGEKPLTSTHTTEQNQSNTGSSAAPVVQPDSAAAVSEEEKWDWERDLGDERYGWITHKGSRLSSVIHYSMWKLVELHNASLERVKKKEKDLDKC